jgi:hypothetical protein
MIHILLVAALACLCWVHWGYIDRVEGWDGGKIGGFDNPTGHYFFIMLYTGLMITVFIDYITF